MTAPPTSGKRARKTTAAAKAELSSAPELTDGADGAQLLTLDRLRRPGRRPPPEKGRAVKTYDRILRAADEILGEVGFERLTTNDICARAEITPPALYYYFDDKYDVLEELAIRLLRRQNEAFLVWMFNGGAWANPENRVQALVEWYRIAVEATYSEPGAIWTLRAMRALQSLAHLRLAEQRMITDYLFAFLRRLAPQMDEKVLWTRLRLQCELALMVEELATEEERIPREVLYLEVARIVAGKFSYDAPATLV
ncbi:MAG: helix-turn-helix domain-containing protein [Caulobacteraceae bacterium]